MTATHRAHRVRRLSPIALAATLGVLIAVPFAPAAASAATPTCFGHEATIVGTMGDDVITGTPGADVIVAKGGNDLIRGLSGVDRICAGDGDDVVRAGHGGDWVSGGPGDDVLGGYKGDDKLFGMAGDDKVFGHLGNDRLDGGRGTDRCFKLDGAGRIADCEAADLSVSVSGPRRTKAGQATFVVRVTNHGLAAVSYKLDLAQSTSNADCGVPVWEGTHARAALTGDSYRELKVVAICSKEGRHARLFLEATVSSHAPDVDPLNNTDRAQVIVRKS